MPQNKVPGEDLWDHTVRSVDAAPAARPVVRLAALLHDIGKPATFADGRFMGHDAVGAELAGAFLDRLRSPRAVRDRVVELVRQHMFSYESSWSDAAVRRFIGKMAAIGDGALDELLDLRAADNVGSGLPAGAGQLDELRARVAAELRADLVLDRGGLAIDGTDLIDALGLDAGAAPRSDPRGVWSSASSRIRRSTSARRSCSSPGRRWPRTADRARPGPRAEGPHAMVPA